MEIYLVRHTKTVLPKSICYGQTDADLELPYQETFEGIKNQLPASFVLYSSSLKRCQLLAEYISEKFQTPVIYDTRLLEMHFGDWEGKAWDDINAEDLNLWMQDFVNVQVPGGESMRMLHERVKSFYKELRLIQQPIVIIAHAGVIRSVLTLLNKTSLEKAFEYKVELGSVTVISKAL
jgi:alpha-ribazole phosphatase